MVDLGADRWERGGEEKGRRDEEGKKWRMAEKGGGRREEGGGRREEGGGRREERGGRI